MTLLKKGKLFIENEVLENLISQSFNTVETNCYKILLSVIEDNEEAEEREREWIQEQLDKDYIKEANNEFRDMMDDFDAWGNID